MKLRGRSQPKRMPPTPKVLPMGGKVFQMLFCARTGNQYRSLHLNIGTLAEKKPQSIQEDLAPPIEAFQIPQEDSLVSWSFAILC